MITDLAYGAIALAAGAVCKRAVRRFGRLTSPYPIRDAGDVVEPIVAALTPRTKLVVIDHVAAQTALVLPVAAVAAECHARGVPVLVDGAHVPGSRPLDIASLGVDWYSGNLHKWAHAPRGCGILWAAPERQSMLHSPVVSWGHGKGFRDEFERHRHRRSRPATWRRPRGSPCCANGTSTRCVKYMHGLAWEAAGILTERWRTTFEIPREMVGAMVTVPLPEAAGTTDADAARLRLALLVEDRIEVHLHAWRGRLWTRISAQIYNDRQTSNGSPTPSRAAVSPLEA